MRNANRPKLHLVPSPLDKLIIGVGWIGAGLLILLPAYYFNQLPEIIPRHFNAQGYPDAYGTKWNIWILTGIALILFSGIKYLANKPEILNYPTRITEVNAKRQYIMAQRMLRLLNLTLLGVFVYLEYSTIEIALDNMASTGKWTLPVILGIITIVLMIYLFSATAVKRKKKRKIGKSS